MRGAFRHAALFLTVAASLPLSALAQSDGPPSGAPSDYAKFAKGLTPQHGLFTLWRREGKVFLDLAKDQLDADFIQTAVPANGLGGFGVTPGLPYVQFPSARIVRFSRVDNKVVVTWPNTSFIATAGTPSARAIAASFAPSVVATAPVVAEDPATGRTVIDASYLLGDIIDMTDALRQTLDTDKRPGATYRLDEGKTYFGPSKAFPENVIVEADQTFVSANPPDAFDTVTDARAVQIDIKYNIAQAPPLDSYMPRLADDRVGYYPNIQLQFDNDRARERQVRTIARWNLARHPMVYYISNTVPMQYHKPIREALLEWNKAFARIGYPNAVSVEDQPDDPSWDADDIRYNTVHWLTQAYGGGYAQAGLVWDPRTGELIHTSIVIDADLMQFGYIRGEDWTNFAHEPAAGDGFRVREAAYAAGAKASAMYGLEALQIMGDVSPGTVPQQYADDFLKAIVLHESGHNWGLQHNFIASQAYSAAEVRSKTFTSQYGLANSVMEYTPTNVWPKGMSTGDYFQTVLGPYDYYAIKWGYARVAGASTPDQERSTLLRWASVWSQPRFRFAMDEDVDWASGHAIDPRIDQFDLTNDNIGWCEAQMRLVGTVFQRLPQRFHDFGETHDPLRQAFGLTFGPINTCSAVARHYIGGEELSRAHVGDPQASLPLVPVTRLESKRAFDFLDRHVLSTAAWNVAPALLRQMVYTEWVTDLPTAGWAYNPPLRHDVPLATVVEGLQQRTLQAIFNPVVLQRLDDMPLKYAPGVAMSLEDAFTWTQRSVYGDLRSGRVASSGPIHRSLQQWYAHQLAQMLLAPARGTPYDAQSLARAELETLRSDVAAARVKRGLDMMTRAHLEALAAVADQALTAHTVVPAMAPAPGP